MVAISFQTLPGASDSDADRAARGAPMVKVSDARLIPIAHLAGCRSVYYRPYLPDDGDCSDGAAWAHQVWGAIKAASPTQPELLGYRNEHSATVEQVRQYQAYRSTLRSLGYIGKVVFGSFSAGTPDWPQWTAMVAAFGSQPPDLTDLHEYWSLTVAGSAPWWALRHVEAIRRGVLPASWLLLIGETGSDNVGAEDPQRRSGWNDAGKLTAAQECANLAAYVAGCAPSVQAVYVFGDGGSNAQWDSYRTFGTPVEAYIRSTWQNPSQSRQDATTTPETPKGAPMPVVDPGAIVTQNEGPSNLCWDVSVGECVIAAGGTSDVNALYQAVKGIPYVAPGQPATFAELIHAVTWAAAANGWQVQWYGADGRINDFGTFQSVVSAGQYYVIAGVKGQALNLGDFGHFEAVKGLYTAPDGTLMVTVADSYAAYDNAGWQPSYPLSEYLAAMAANWDPNADAIGFRFVVPASTAPAAPAPVAAPTPTPAATIPADEQAAYAYFTQTGIGIDRSHALWTVTLLPMYRKWEAMAAANDALADLYHPGPLAGPETGARWGGTQPASVVRLTNETVGSFLSKGGAWLPYRPEGA